MLLSKTHQLDTKMCLAGIFRSAHKICGSSPTLVNFKVPDTWQRETILVMPKKWHALTWKRCFMPRNRSGSHFGFAGSVEGSSPWLWLTMVLNYDWSWSTIVMDQFQTVSEHGQKPWCHSTKHGQRQWITMVDHGRPWYYMVDHGSSWLTIVFHGWTWSFMINSGSSWSPNVSNHPYHGPHQQFSVKTRMVSTAALPTFQMQNQGRGCHFWRTFHHFQEHALWTKTYRETCQNHCHFTHNVWADRTG